MALSLSLPAMLDTMISALAPGPPYFDSDLSSIQAGNHCVATAQLSHALLRESHNVQGVATTLWDALLDSVSSDGENSGITNFLDAFTVETADLRGCPLVVSVAHTDIWQTLASSGERSESLKRIIIAWAAKWFNILLLPVQGRSRTPSVAETTSTGRTQQALKNQLLLRDGHTSPISNYTDWDTDDSHLEFYDDDVGENRLVVAHIIPYSLNRRPDALSYLETFSGGRVGVDSLIGRSINKTSNAFLIDSNTHASFDRFHFAICADTAQTPPVYTLTCFSARKVPPIVKLKAADGTKIPFGRVSPVDLPDPDLCNLHCSLGRVLHAAGAAEIVDSIMKDENDFFDGDAQFETVPSQNSEIAAHYVCRKLQSLQVQAY